ncbi:MAG: hypothetical protein IIV12_01480, partial [Bacteroidales bacterium]|nr:hypothetical protein [Bacteroidales bacterium]
ALDKNYIDVSDDSLARVALDYYSRKGPAKYEARSQYYLALSYYYADDLRKAILEATKADAVAEASDSLYFGFVKVLQADIYAKTHNDVEVLKNLNQAYDVYSRLSLPYYVNVAQLRLSKALYNSGYVSKADSLLSLLIKNKDTEAKIKAYALTDRAFIKIVDSIPDYPLAISMYENVVNDYGAKYMTYKDYWVYSYALERVGRQEESQYLVDKLSQLDSSVSAYYWRYRIEVDKGNITEALSVLEKSVTMHNEEVTESLRQSLASTQREYYESQYREASLQVRVKNQMIIIVVSFAVVILLLILHFVHRRISSQQAEKEQLMEYVDEIKRQLVQAKDENYPLLKRRFIDLYKSRFDTIGMLCDQFLQNKDRSDVEKVMYQKMLLMIEEIRNDKVRKVKFESLLNSELDGIIQNFRTEMPKSKEWEVTMFSYLVVGFDATTISRLMDMPLNNVYAYKRRLKLKIEEKKPEHSSQFLEMITR